MPIRLFPFSMIKWENVAQKILEEPGRVILLGEADTGKTTFCLELANLGIQKGFRVAVLDLDIGQSHIGPPSTLGLGNVTSPIQDLNEVVPLSLFFIGVLSPGLEPLRIIQGMERLLQVYRHGMPCTYPSDTKHNDLLLVDTSGFVHESQALSLKWKKFSLLQPDHFVFLERENELEGLKRLSEREEGRKHFLKVPSEIRRKSPEARRSYRMDLWKKTFQNGSHLTLPRGLLTFSQENLQSSDLRGTLVGLLGPGETCLGLGFIERIGEDGVELYTTLKKASGIEKIFVGRTKEPATALGWST